LRFEVEFGGGESKNLRSFFDGLQTHHTRKIAEKYPDAERHPDIRSFSVLPVAY
jgi:hypothetical protein